MKSIRLIVPALIAVSLLVVSLAWAQGGNPPASTKESGKTSGHGMTAVEQAGRENVEKQIAALSDQLTQAFAKADTGFMEKYFADDFTAIHSDGNLSTKAQEIDNVKSGALKWDSVDTHESKIHAYGDTAVRIALASSKGTVGGKPYSGDYRTTQFWVKHKGNWKIVAFQSTRVPSASQ
ncbi:MAG: nuclear transport factor 2 family protein [Terriglobales bacterium]